MSSHEGSDKGYSVNLFELTERLREVVSEARLKKATVRGLGGVAIDLISNSARNEPALRREHSDYDLITLKEYLPTLKEVFDDLGLEEDKKFNALNGEFRLIYHDQGIKVDIFIDEFRMSHNLDLRNRLNIRPVTISVSDLILTKLQIFEINKKDLTDLISLLKDFSPGTSENEFEFDVNYLGNVLSRDWGLYKTSTDNISKLESFLTEVDLSDSYKDELMDKIEKIKEVIETSPKSMNWRIRSRIGTKVKWYNVPDEVGK